MVKSQPGKIPSVSGQGLESGHEFQIEQSGGKPLGHSVGGVGKIFYKEIGNGILPVNDIKNFKTQPDIIKGAKGIVTSSVGFVVVEQQGAESDIGTDIGIND